MKHTLLFATIASFVVVHAYANNIVTSKTYVDNRDALKVDIAQGVGTNNANVGKTLVVNSSGNLELGTPAAGNYVEDSITDGVTTKAPSENAVHDALEDKQDVIQGYNSSTGDKSVLTDTTTDGVIGKMTLYDSGSADSDIWENPEGYDNYIPTAGALGQIAALKQNNLGGSGNGGKVVTATDTAGTVTYTAILDMDTYESNFNLDDLKDDTNIVGHIPTVGTLGVTLSEKQNVLGGSGRNGKVVTATDTAGTVTYTATYDGSGTYNAQNDAGKIATAAAVNTRQAKKTCAGWLDGTTTPDATHTDANCVLWNLPD